MRHQRYWKINPQPVYHPATVLYGPLYFTKTIKNGNETDEMFVDNSSQLSCLNKNVNTQQTMIKNQTLDIKQQSIITIAALTAKGEVEKLEPALNLGVEAGLTINKV